MHLRNYFDQNFFPSKYSAVILLYHRIVDLEHDPQLLAVSPANFDLHVKHLKKEYELLSFDDLSFLLKHGKQIPHRSVLISFDDGYYDNFVYSKPIIETYDAPAIYFITTSNINSKVQYWWDALEHCILKNNTFPLTIRFTCDENQISEYVLKNLSDNQAVYNKLIVKFRNIKPEYRIKAIEEIEFICKKTEGRASHRAMSTHELQELSKSPLVTIGAHTVNHPSLTALDLTLQRQEIQNSREQLSQLISKEIKYFSYPFGTVKDYDRETIKICEEEGFYLSAANYPGKTFKKTHKHKLPRNLVRNWDINEFSSKLSTFFK